MVIFLKHGSHARAAARPTKRPLEEVVRLRTRLSVALLPLALFSAPLFAAGEEPISNKPMLSVKPSSIADDSGEGGTAYDEIEAQRKKAEKEGNWAMSRSEQVAVDNQVLTKQWHKVPFDQRPFSYSREQIRNNWDKLMGDMAVPYPSAKLLRDGYVQYPEFKEQHKDFDGDYDKLERDLGEVWYLFLRGDFQAAMERGQQLGPMGTLAGKVSQVFYAVYLEPDLDQKHMLLQDAANTIREYGPTFDEMKHSKDPVMRNNAIIASLAYIYSIGRIAEDVPIPVAISRNYVFKVLGAIKDIREISPDNPLGLAASAGADANVIRKVGKAAGRITFNARQTTINEYFERALKTSDLAVIRLEYANSMLYINKRRDITQALDQLKRASMTRPRFAMEALDAMYAAKRRKEVEALAKSNVSFRSFERQRTRYMRENKVNLYCVLPSVCKPFIVTR